MKSKSKAIILIMNSMLIVKFFLFILISSIVLFALVTKSFSQVWFSSLLFFSCSILLSNKFAICLYRKRASMFYHGDPVILISRGVDPQYGKFDRIVSEYEDWMPDNLREDFFLEVSMNNSPIAVITTEDNKMIAIAATTRLLAVR